jgi:hypothetical protein
VEGQPHSIAIEQRILIDLAHLLGRAMQYSPGHPSCTGLLEKVHAGLGQALEWEPQLVFGILRDNVMIGEVPAAHPAVRARIASHLHDRGVLALRFLRGVTFHDLFGFLELVLLPVQTVFDRGGLIHLLLDRGITRIQVEELVHEISDVELEAGRRRRRLRDFFTDALRDLRARRDIHAPLGERVAEMLDHPEVAVTILEDQGAGLAEAAAGFALLVQQEERRTGQALAPKLRAIFAALAPMARERIVLGFPPLLGEFRAALAWAMRGFREDDLAHFTFPAVRARAHELDLVLYALSVLVPHDGTRLSILRRVGLMLHDMPADDAIAGDVLAAIARPVEGFESYKRERQCLGEPAARALGARSLATLASASESLAFHDLSALDGRGAMREVVMMASYTKHFERFCRRMPEAAAALAEQGAGGAVLELVRALAEVQRPEWRELGAHTAEAVASAQAEDLLFELEKMTAAAGDHELGEVRGFARMIVGHAPRPVLDYLDLCQNERLRHILVEALPLVGPRLVPLLRKKLTADAPANVVELMAILPRVEGRADDLLDVARHRDEAVRLEVARLLRALPADERAMDIVVRYLVDPSPQVRSGVRLLVRGELLGPHAIASAGRIIEDQEQPDEVRRRLIQALGHSRHDAAAQVLFHLLQPHGLIEIGPAAALRDLAAAALRSCPAPIAARLFQEGLDSPVRRVRKACERAARGGEA